MLLVNAHVTYYRSAEDSEEFTVEPDVTCLVGKNESGKTNIAQALFRLNPVEPASFDEIIDFPARMTAKKRDFKADTMIPVVIATFVIRRGPDQQCVRDDVLRKGPRFNCDRALPQLSLGVVRL